MNLVANQQHVVRAAQFAQTAQFVGCPDASHGIVGVAEQQHGGLFERQGSFDSLPVDCEMQGRTLRADASRSVCLAEQGNFECLATGVADEVVETVIHRSQDDHIVARLDVSLQDGSNGGNHADGIKNLLATYMPLVARPEPPDDGLVILVGHQRIAIARVHGALRDGILDTGCGGKIHICHPQGQHILRLLVPLHRTCTPTLDGLVKVEQWKHWQAVFGSCRR